MDVYDKIRGTELKPTTDYFMCAIEAVMENRQRYQAAAAQALLQPKSPMAGFTRSFAVSQMLKPDEDE